MVYCTDKIIVFPSNAQWKLATSDVWLHYVFLALVPAKPDRKRCEWVWVQKMSLKRIGNDKERKKERKKEEKGIKKVEEKQH